MCSVGGSKVLLQKIMKALVLNVLKKAREQSSTYNNTHVFLLTCCRAINILHVLRKGKLCKRKIFYCPCLSIIPKYVLCFQIYRSIVASASDKRFSQVMIQKCGHLRIYYWLPCKFVKMEALILKYQYIQIRLMI